MSKEIVIIIGILIIVFGLNYISEKYTDDSINLLYGNFESLKKSISNDNNIDSSDNINELINNWNNVSEYLAFYIEHDELEKVDTYLTEVKSSIERNDFNNASEKLDVCEFILTHINEKQAFVLKNIF